jgi:hypothetical protein
MGVAPERLEEGETEIKVSNSHELYQTRLNQGPHADGNERND